MERTLAIIKPDAVERKLIGAIIQEIHFAKLDIIAMEMIHMTTHQAKEFYKAHKGKDFFERLINFMSSGRSIVMVLEGENAIERWRDLMGSTDPAEAGPLTIRGLMAVHGDPIHRNLVHGSDSEGSARDEIAHFFVPSFFSAR